MLPRLALLLGLCHRPASHCCVGTGHPLLRPRAHVPREEQTRDGPHETEVRVPLPGLQKEILLLGDNNHVPEDPAHLHLSVPRALWGRVLSTSGVPAPDFLCDCESDKEALSVGDSKRTGNSVPRGLNAHYILWSLLHCRGR